MGFRLLLSISWMVCALALSVSPVSAQSDIVFESDLPELQRAYDAASSERDRAEAGYRLGVRTLDHGDAAGAVEIFSTVFNIQKSQVQGAPSDLEALSRLQDLDTWMGDANFVLIQLEQAAAHYRSAIQTVETLIRKDPDNLRWNARQLDLNGRLALVQAGRGQINAAAVEELSVTSDLKAVAASGTDDRFVDLALMASYGRAGDMFLALGEEDDAETFFGQAYDLGNEMFGKQWRSLENLDELALAYERLGKFHEMNERSEHSITAYRIANSIREVLASEQTNSVQHVRRLINSHLTLARLSAAAQDTDATATHIAKGLELARQLQPIAEIYPKLQYGPTEPRYFARNLLLSGYGVKPTFAGDLSRAEFRRRLGSGDRDGAGWSFDLIRALHFAGTFQDKQGNYVKAVEHYRELLKINIELADRNPENIELKRAVSESYYFIGFFLSEIGKTEESIMNFKHGIEIDRHLILHKQQKSDIIELYIKHEHLGDMYYLNGNFESAHQNLNESLNLFNIAHKDIDSDLELKLDQSYLMQGVGDSLIELGNENDGLLYLNDALKIVKNSILTEPKNERAHNYELEILFSLSRVSSSGIEKEDVFDKMEKMHNLGFLSPEDEKYFLENRQQ